MIALLLSPGYRHLYWWPTYLYPEDRTVEFNIYYLQTLSEDHPDYETLRDLRLNFALGKKETVTQAEFEAFWETVGTDDVAHPEDIFGRWNAGSGRECVAFARRECTGCDAVFTGKQDDGTVDLRIRQHNADNHEAATGHDVAHGTRSFSKGDIVVNTETGDAYLCATRWPELDVTEPASVTEV